MKKTVCVILCILAAMSIVCSACAETLSETMSRIVEDEESLVTMWSEDLSDLMGIGEETYTDYYYMAAADSLTGREIIVIVAVDGTAAEEIEEKLNRYREQRLKETRNYLPEAYRLVESSTVIRDGLTVILDIGDNAEDEITMLLKKE